MPLWLAVTLKDPLSGFMNFQPMYEFLKYVVHPDATAQDVVTLLTEPITSLETTGFEFPGIAVLFDLWFQFFQQGELFSPSAVEDRASLDVRFGKEEGFFTQVVSDAIFQSLLTSLMKGKVADSFDTFDVFGSILKFAVQTSSTATLLTKESPHLEAHFTDLYSFNALIFEIPSPKVIIGGVVREINPLHQGVITMRNISAQSFVEIFQHLNEAEFKLSTSFTLNLSSTENMCGRVSNGRLFLPLKSLLRVDLRPFFLEAASSEPLFKGLVFSLPTFQGEVSIPELRNFAIFLDKMKDVISEFILYSKDTKLRRLYTFFRPESDHVPALWTLDTALAMASLIKENNHQYFIVEMKPLPALELEGSSSWSNEKLFVKYPMLISRGIFPALMSLRKTSSDNTVLFGHAWECLSQNGEKRRAFYCQLHPEESLFAHCVFRAKTLVWARVWSVHLAYVLVLEQVHFRLKNTGFCRLCLSSQDWDGDRSK